MDGQHELLDSIPIFHKVASIAASFERANSNMAIFEITFTYLI